MALEHRGRCCLEGHTVTEPGDLHRIPWLAALDWSVYHAPDAAEWQAFRVSLLKVSVAERYGYLRLWLAVTNPQDHVRKQRSVDVIRVMNICRSLRGQWSAVPELRWLAGKLKDEWDRRRL